MSTQLERVIHLLSLLQSGIPYNAIQLAQELSVHRRTLFRDLAQLKSLGLPLGYDPVTARYWLNKNAGFAGFNPTGEEICELLILAASSWLNHDKRYRRKGIRAMAKLARLLPHNEREELHRVFQAVASSHEPVDSDSQSQQVVTTIIEAIRRKLYLHVELKEEAHNEREFYLAPQHLLHTVKNCYLDAWTDPDCRRIRIDVALVECASLTSLFTPDHLRFEKQTDFDLIITGG